MTAECEHNWIEEEGEEPYCDLCGVVKGDRPREPVVASELLRKVPAIELAEILEARGFTVTWPTEAEGFWLDGEGLEEFLWRWRRGDLVDALLALARMLDRPELADGPGGYP